MWNLFGDKCWSSCRYQWVMGWTKWKTYLFIPTTAVIQTKLMLKYSIAVVKKSLQFSTMDVSVRAMMKGAAKCDKHCELQNSVSRQGLEHILCFWDIPKSTLASVSILHCFSSCFIVNDKLLQVAMPQYLLVPMLLFLRFVCWQGFCMLVSLLMHVLLETCWTPCNVGLAVAILLNKAFETWI